MLKKTVITYGTFDLFHIGHLRILQRAKQLGSELIVGVSTDEFNKQKGKRSFMPFEQRSEIVAAIDVVDRVIPENSWDQKRNDILTFEVDTFCIGDDWAGKFDDLRDICEVTYLKRTEGIDSTSIRSLARAFDCESIDRLRSVHKITEDLLSQLDR